MVCVMTVSRRFGGGLAVAALAAAPMLGLAGTALAADPTGQAPGQGVAPTAPVDNRGWSAAGGQGKSGDDMADEPWRVNKDWNWVKDWCVNHTKESKLPGQPSSYAGISCPPVWND
ncbi:hypothetical protein Ae406Ps2_6114c [Pseudonocardia sp. Ae406_Ps2]|nr:hypothetical protein Ae406Ps2_6114c [Pseudonocardia sp. Ae406_Ps2]